uniref:Nicastrin n=1 Tax=Myripristis murdjan TaxID=586833 RepID=A0A667YLQ2_9TELE
MGVSCNSVEQKIYVELNNMVPCVRLLNATHQIGCQSSISGDVGVIHVLESEANLEWVLSTGPNPPYMVILESALFTRSIMMKLKNGTGRVAGAAVVVSKTNPAEGFSPHTKCPNENTGVYSESYDPTMAHCNVTVWNPLGNGLSYEDHCVVQLCLTCHCTVWLSDSKGHKEGESMVIAATRLDSRSFFWDVAPGAESAVSGFVTLLAAAHALHNVTQEAHPPRTILYTFFQGEAFDYIGSSRMVYEMDHKQFAIDLDNVHSVVEIGQVGLRSSSELWVHSDPVSRRNNSINAEVSSLIDTLKSAAMNLNVTMSVPSFSQPLPPSSFQRFLRARPIPGVVIADHQSAFSNRYYESIYDKAANLNLTYPANLTEDEQLEFVTETANALADLATVVARALYKQAGGADAQLINIKAEPKIVTQMLYGFLVRSNNTWFQALVPPEFKNFLSKLECHYYVGVSQTPSHARTPTRLVQYLLANLTGTTINITKENCHNSLIIKPSSLPQLYSYVWVQGVASPNSTERQGFCVRSSVRLSKAVSPAFDLLQEYSSKDYSTWTESRWKFIKARIFLVASHDLEMLTLGVGVGILLSSLLLTYIISSKADILFSSGREPANATY